MTHKGADMSNTNDAPERIWAAPSPGFGWEDIIGGNYDAGLPHCVKYIRADLVPAPAVPDDVAAIAATMRARDMFYEADAVEAQAAELARLRQEAARIADDYHPERGQEALALSEMREAIAALPHPTGD